MTNTRARAAIFVLTIAMAVGAGLYFANWGVFFAFYFGGFVALSLVYALMEWPLGWPKLRWMQFFGDLIDLAFWT